MTRKFVKGVIGIFNSMFENITERMTNAMLSPIESAAFSIQSTSLKNNLTTTYPGRNKTYIMPRIALAEDKKGYLKNILMINDIISEAIIT